MLPDIFIEPAVVIEVLGMEITKSPSNTAGQGKGETGLALRFPRFLRIRRDKGPYEATTVKETRELKEELERTIYLSFTLCLKNDLNFYHL